MWKDARHRFQIALFCLAGLFFLINGQATAQTAEAYLNRAREHYRTDDFEAAGQAYQAAFDLGEANTQLYALTGMIKIAASRSRIEEADSLVKAGQKLDKDPAIKTATSCAFAISVGEFYRSNSQFDKALTSHKSVIARSSGLTNDRIPYADALFYTALTFERLGLYDSSVYYVSHAYDVYKEVMDTTDLRFSSIYNGMGVCYYRANRLAESKQYYLLAKSIAEQQQNPYSSDLALCLSNLSSIYRAEEDYESAIAVTEKALHIFQYLKDENGVAGAYYGLGVYHYFLGDYGKTKDYMQSCIGIRERLFHKNHYSLIGPYQVLGISYEESGDYEKTLLMLEKAREKIIANYGQNSIEEGFNCENRAITLKITGQLDSALTYIKLAHRILPLHLDPNDYSLAINYYNYADILFGLDRYDQALALIDRSMAIYDEQEMQYSSENAQNVQLKALIAGERGQWKLADRYFSKVLEMVKLPSILNEGLNDALNPWMLSVLNEYTNYLFQKYRANHSEKTLEEMQHYAKLYLQLSEQFRLRFNDPYTKSILIKKNAESHQQKVGIYNLLYRQSQQAAFLDQAYLFSEYGRTAMLRDLQNDRIRSYAGLPDSLLVKERQLKRWISDYSEQLEEKPDSLELRQALLEARGKLDVHIEEVSHQYPRYHQLRFASQVPSLDSLLQILPEGHNLIQYMQDDTAYYGLLVNAEEKVLTWLGNKDYIHLAMKEWRAAITTQQEQLPDELLFKALWEPFSKKFQGERIIIVPVGQLFYLNFELLSHNGSYLIEDYNISYALSFSTYFSSDQNKQKGRLLAIAPGFEEEIKEHYLSKLDSLEVPDKDYLRTLRQPWSVSYTKELGQTYSNYILAGLSATESQVKQKLPQGQVIFFGTHAIAEAEDPLRSRLVLAKETGEQVEDGYLHAYELYGLPLSAGLTILSACESGLGQLQEGEGMVSLAYSIQYAGCPSTVMSLWKVDEKINTEISRSFLQHLSSGMEKSEALRQAKLDYLASGGQAHPFYWGGMVLMGQDGEVAMERKGGSWMILVGMVLLGGILLGMGWRKWF